MIEGDQEICPDCGNAVDECTCCTDCVCEAKDYIRSAINSLSVCAKDNDLIKECIANLGVVLLDLSCAASDECCEAEVAVATEDPAAPIADPEVPTL